MKIPSLVNIKKENLLLIFIMIGGAFLITAAVLGVLSSQNANKDNINKLSSESSFNESKTSGSQDILISSNLDSSLGESTNNSSTNSAKNSINNSTNNISSSISASVTPVIKTANLSIWSHPAGVKQNNSFSVFVKETGKTQWNSLFVYNVKVGHQEGNDPLRSLVGMEYYGPIDTSMANFDFSGKVDFKVVYQKSALNSYNISPDSYQISAKKDNNTLYFSIDQNIKAPRKIVIRANGDWDKNVLHIVTNPMETGAPKVTDTNVYVVEPGKDVPRVLPEGKTVYYFKPGIHDLPRGSWVDFDLGRTIPVDRFDLICGTARPFIVPGAQKFRIEYKENQSSQYKTCYENLTNNQLNLEKITFPTVNARYIRLVLLGNNTSQSGSGYNYLNSNNVKEFRIYEKSTQNNVILNKAIDGSSLNYYAICDGADSTNTYYGHIYSAESFFVARDGYTIYLAPGSYVKGAINSDWKSSTTIKGRGILDCGNLVHDPAKQYAEGRTSAIRSEYSDDILIDGITILDSPMWGIITNFSQNPIVRNINFFGSIVNSDGVHMSGVTNGLVEGCFIRTTDDIFVMYHYGPADGVKVKNSVFLSDGGRIVLLGMASSKGDISNVSFENNDILNVQNVWDMFKHGGAFSLWASGGNTIRNIVFKNIRIEAFREPKIAALFQIKTIDESGWGSGKIDGVTFDTINYKGSGEAVSYALGDSSVYSVKNLTFKNFLYGGKLITDSYHPNIEIRNYVYSVNYSK